MKNTVEIVELRNQVIIDENNNIVEVLERPNNVVIQSVGIQGVKGDTGGIGNAYIEIPIGAVNGLNADFTLSFLPIENTLQVFVGMGAVFKDRDFSLNAQIITFFTPPLLGEIITTTYNY